MTTDLTPQIRRLACYDCGDCGRRIYGIRRIARHDCEPSVIGLDVVTPRLKDGPAVAAMTALRPYAITSDSGATFAATGEGRGAITWRDDVIEIVTPIDDRPWWRRWFPR